MKQYTPRVGTPAPYASHHLFIGTSVQDALKSAMGDYLEIAQDFFVAGAVISSTPSGSGALYSITAGHLMYKGELMEVDAHSVLKSASQVIYIGVQDDAMDVAPVLNTDGNTDYVMRRRHARLRVASVYPTEYMAITAMRKTDIDRLRNKGRLVPQNGMVPYVGDIGPTLFDSSGLGLANSVMDGWAICNGNNGTPDMRGLVAIGATSVPSSGAPTPHAEITGTSDVGDVVGNDLKTLTADQLPPHKHPFTDSEPGIDPAFPDQIAGGTAIAIQHIPDETGFNVTAHDPVDVKQASMAVVWLMSIV